MTQPLHGRVALVTGGSRGIGQATAMILARHGAAVAVNYLEQAEAAENVVRSITDDGGRAMAVQADIREADAVTRMTAQITTSLGPVEILVNNAGILRDKPVSFMTPQEWHAVLDTCLTGAFYVIKSVAKPMARAKWGRIVNISSDAGLLGDTLRANYASAKAGLIGLTKTVARELAPSGITVNALAPGIIETDLVDHMSPAKRQAMLEHIPMRRFGSPDDVARAVLALVTEPGAYITGETLRIDGGLAMR